MRVFHQNESYHLDVSFLHSSREDGGKKGSFRFDETFSFWSIHTVVLIAHPSAFVPIHAKKVIVKQVVLLVKVLN